MARILAFLHKAEVTVVIVSFIVMVLAAFAQVVNRNIFHAGISWFEELSRYAMVYMAMLATELGLRDGTQLAIVFLAERFHGVSRKLLDITAALLVVAYSAIVCVSSTSMLERQISTWQISAGMRLPMLIPYAAVTLAFGIITMVQTASIVVMIRDLFSGGGEAAKGGAA